MKEQLEKAIKANAIAAEKAANNADYDAALKFSQAALNAAHALITITNIDK